MKILHTSDWHLGMPVGNHTYIEDQKFFLSQLYKIIEREQIEVVICAGDIYDSSVSNAQSIALYNEVTTTICNKMNKRMVVIAGNHDGAARLSSCSELLKKAGLYVSGRLTRDIEPLEIEDVAIYSIPFFNRDEVVALFPEKKEKIRSQEQAAKVVCDDIREKMDKSKKNIIVSHSYIVNAQLSDSDRSAQVGFATAISKEVFDGFDYVALGHIHKPQIISDTIRYSGSPVKYSFGNEEKQSKGVVVIDTKTMEQEFVPLKMLHDRKTVEGTLEEIMNRTELADCYLKLKITDKYAGLELLSQLREAFPYVLEIYGKSIEENGTYTAMSVSDLQQMDEMTIMKKFFAENFQYEPNEEQIELFEQVLNWSREEGESQ